MGESIRTPPMDLEAEAAVLGGILLDEKLLPVALEHVKAGDFHRQSHQLVFEAMCALMGRGEPIDPLTVAAQLRQDGNLDRCGGLTYVSLLLEQCPSLSAVETYARKVREKARRREILHAAQETIRVGYDEQVPTEEFVDQAQRVMLEAVDSRAKGAKSLKTLMGRHWQVMRERFDRRGQGVTGTTTGFSDLDEMLLGLQPSDLIIVAGRPAMGKTTFAVNIAMNAARLAGARALVWSLEMGDLQLADRIAASEAKIELNRVRSGWLSDGEWPRLTGAYERLTQLPVYIEETPAVTVLDVRARARRLAMDGGLDLIVVDYLQLMRASSTRKNGTREQEISEISRGLKGLAKELNIPVIALSQLNRGLESRADKRPMMSDLRESGAIEQDADVICFVYRDEVYHADSDDKGIAEIIVAKHRNGPTGTVKLRFTGEFSRFDNLTQREG